MDAVEALKRAVEHSHRWFDGTTADVTQEQADYLPAGVGHPIGELIAHVIQSEDGIVNGILQGKPSVWESGGWEKKLGVPNMMDHSREVARGFTCDVAALQPYKEAVYASTKAYLDGIDEAELAHEVEGPFGSATVLDFLTNALLGNTFAHTGEISALKGMQGAKGYPF